MARRTLQLLLVLVLALAVIASRKCYSGVSVCGDKHPKSKETCKSNYCVKITSALNYESQKVYGCDDGTCKENGCHTDLTFAKEICCCSKDLCNTSSIRKFLVPVMIAVVIASLL
ncbi:hypothetical protein V3C99_007854 [Haemonchus contortus]